MRRFDAMTSHEKRYALTCISVCVQYLMERTKFNNTYYVNNDRVASNYQIMTPAVMRQNEKNKNHAMAHYT